MKKNDGLRKNDLKNSPGKQITGEAWRRNYFLILCIILLISFLAYVRILNNGFVWDDEGYIQDNPLIHSINLKELFSSYVMGNYHPLTMLVHAVEYHFFNLNAKGYHAVNLLLHLLNVVLVFYVVLLLTEEGNERKRKNDEEGRGVIIALVASLLFGIHPIHVESIAWASELKDVLYSFFFLLSTACYLLYLKNREKRFYFYSLLLFLFSLLSKAMAVSLPVALLLIDFFKGRRMNVRAWLEKIPFLLLAVIFGIVAIYAQVSRESINTAAFTFPQRIIFACYSFISYLLKLMLPLQLSAYYPYPIRGGENIPAIYFFYLFLVAAVIVFIFYSLRHNKKIFFGVGYFAVTVFVVLQLLPAGGAIMADRYCYIPSVGIFYLAGEGFYFLWNKKNAVSGYRLPAVIILLVVTVFFSLKTYALCGIWKNSFTLWDNVISQYQTVSMAYNNRGIFLKDENKDEQALNDFNKAIELMPENAEAYFDRATLFEKMGKHGEAIADFTTAIERKHGFALAYNSRGSVFLSLGKTEEALKDFNKFIELKPEHSKGWFNRGNVFLNTKKFPQAINDFSEAIRRQPDFADAYYNRAVSEFESGKKDAACNDLKKAADLGLSSASEGYDNLCR